MRRASLDGILPLVGDEGEVELRLENRQRVWVLMLSGLDLLLALMYFAGGSTGRGIVWTALAALLVVTYFAQAGWGVDLGPDGARLRGLRQRLIPWHEVRDVEVKSLMGVRGVVLHRSSGAKTRLRAPVDAAMMRDPAFDAKVDGIRRWWTSHHGATR